MALRLLSCGARKSFEPTIRTLRTSIVAQAGRDHHEPPQVTPKTVSKSKGIFEKVPSSVFESSPEAPGPNDYATYFGAGVGVMLTILAVTFYTDLFGMNRLKKDQHSSSKEAATSTVKKVKNEVGSAAEEENKLRKTEVPSQGAASTPVYKIIAEIEKNTHPDQTKLAEKASVEEERKKPRSPDTTTQEISPLSASEAAELTTRVTEKIDNK